MSSSSESTRKGLSKFVKDQLEKELEEWEKDPPNGFTLIGIFDYLKRWVIEVRRANETYQFEIEFPNDYPMKAPQVIFKDPAPAHPRINSHGYTPLDDLYEKGSPAQILKSICNSIATMMSEKPKNCLTKRKGTHLPVVDVCRREVGVISQSNFFKRFYASENSVLRLEIDRTLESHEGSVHTVSFNGKGDILISGGNDGQVILWDWRLGNVKHSFDHDNEDVYQAKFIDDQTIVTCGGRRVRQAKIGESGEVDTSVLGSHEGEACGLCIDRDPENPLIYTCGADGLVQRFDLTSNETPTQLFKCQSLNGENAVHLNTISIDPTNYKLAVGGKHDKYARVYDIRRLQAGRNGFTPPITHFCPPDVADEKVVITDLVFSEQGELVVSYYNEDIYLFRQDDMGLGSNPRLPSPTGVSSSSVPLGYKGHNNIDLNKRVSFFGASSEYVVSGSDYGRIYFWRKKTGELVHVTEPFNRAVNCVASHPHDLVLASSGSGGIIKVWNSTAAERATIPDLSGIQVEDDLMELDETESEDQVEDDLIAPDETESEDPDYESDSEDE